MGLFKEIKGDLINIGQTGQMDFIGHGCNCQKLMGAGIALQIKNKFPAAFEADQNDERLSTERLGDMTWGTVRSHPMTTVVNLYTQYMPGKDLNLSALRLSLWKLNMMFPGKSIALPQIGCGIAGGDWEVVREIIREELRDMDVVIVEYNG